MSFGPSIATYNSALIFKSSLKFKVNSLINKFLIDATMHSYVTFCQKGFILVPAIRLYQYSILDFEGFSIVYLVIDYFIVKVLLLHQSLARKQRSSNWYDQKSKHK